jgi:hypothetical protein
MQPRSSADDAAAALGHHGAVLGRIFRALAPYAPTLVGTFPLGLQVDGSDLDIACTCADVDAFAQALTDLGFPRVDRRPLAPDAIVAAMTVGDVEVEVFGQALPVHAQAGFRHMIVEGRLLVLGGAPLADRVRAAKRAGHKTEPAFAAVLGLPGDPYRALLDLEPSSEAQLRALVERALR